MVKKKATRIVGIDYGLARIGLSVSDETKILATPFCTVTAERKIEATVLKMRDTLLRLQQEKDCEIEEIVIGLPLQMNGTMGMLADEVKHFVSLFSKYFTCPIKTWDERLTTVQAERSLRESSMTRKQRSKVVDNVTAIIILQNYLDSRPSPELKTNP